MCVIHTVYWTSKNLKGSSSECVNHNLIRDQHADFLVFQNVKKFFPKLQVKLSPCEVRSDVKLTGSISRTATLILDIDEDDLGRTYTNTQIHKHTDTEIQIYTNIQIQKYRNAEIQKYTSSHTPTWKSQILMRMIFSFKVIYIQKQSFL